MASSGLFELVAYTALHAADAVPSVDSTDGGQGSQGSVKKITWANVFGSALPITVVGGTITTSAPVLQGTQTWNAAGVTFTGLDLNVTDTASAAGSVLMNLRVGGTSKWKVDKSGNASVGGTITVASGVIVSAGGIAVTGVSTITDSGSGAVPLVVKNTNGSFGGNVVAALATRAASTGYVLYSGTANAVDVYYVLGNGNVVNTNNSYGALSDRRFKANIVDAGSAVDLLRQIPFREFDVVRAFHHRKVAPLKTPIHQHFGIVAQEVQTVAPWLLDTDAHGYLSARYSYFGVMAARGVQELALHLDRHEARIAALES